MFLKPNVPLTNVFRTAARWCNRFGLLILPLCAASAATTDRARAFSPAPSAELHYAVVAQHSGLSLKGSTSIQWTATAGRYDVRADTKAAIVGKLLESHSEGTIGTMGAEGLTPLKLTEKRFRKPPHSVTFDRKDMTIRFSESATTYPFKGGEQDRTSITWQLVGLARGAPDRVKPGTEWSFLVAGRKDAETWAFRVVGRETIRTPMGDIAAIHITKLPSASREQQQLDLWLAPSHDWYPARIVFRDSRGTDLDQVLQRIDKRP